MQAKRLFAGLLSAVMLMTVLPVGASAAGYTPPALPDVFQGDGLYITATPWKVQADGDWVLASPDWGFHDGRVLVRTSEEVRDQYGYLIENRAVFNYADRDGNLLPNTGLKLYQDNIDNGASNFSEGLCKFKDTETQLYGYIDKTGGIAIEPQFESARDFSDGMAVVETEQGYYYIDKSGEKVLGPYTEISELGDFGDGLAGVDLSDPDSYEEFVGFINKQGEQAITLYKGSLLDYDSDKYLRIEPNPSSASKPWRVSQFSEGYAILIDERNGRKNRESYIVIDTEGNEVGTINPAAPLLAKVRGSGVHDGLIVVDFIDTEGTGQGGGGAAVDIHGNIVVPYGSVTGDFDNGLALGAQGMSIVDTKGNTVIPSDAEQFVSFNQEAVATVFGTPYLSPHFTDFDDGLSLFTMNLMGNGGMTVLAEWHYLLEVHEGTYTGGGKVYNAATGQITGGGSTPTDSETPTEPTGDTPSSWAVENVNTAVEAGIVPDTLQSAYTQATTRAEFCALAVELYETVMGTEITERATFSDTTDVNVEKMAGLGVVNGVGDGRFDPSASLTREEAATMLSRLANVMEKPLTAGTASFADNASISSWASEAVGQVQASGIMNGIEGNQFAPSDPYTREQSIVTMLRLYDFVK